MKEMTKNIASVQSHNVFMQAAAVAITTAIVTLWYRRTFFTPALQLKLQTNASTA